MSLSIAETATWAYDLRGEADMLEYVNCLAGPRNAWSNGTITLGDGSTITLDEDSGTYSFEFHDGKPVPETRAATMDLASHPRRTPGPIFPGFYEQLVWRKAITKVLLQHGFEADELPADHQMPLTRHHAELIAPASSSASKTPSKATSPTRESSTSWTTRPNAWPPPSPVPSATTTPPTSPPWPASG